MHRIFYLLPMRFFHSVSSNWKAMEFEHAPGIGRLLLETSRKRKKRNIVKSSIKSVIKFFWRAGKVLKVTSTRTLFFSLSLTFLTLIGSSKHNPWAGWCQCDAKDATDTFDPKTLIMLSMRAQEACLKQKMWCRKEPRNKRKKTEAQCHENKSG